MGCGRVAQQALSGHSIVFDDAVIRAEDNK